MSPCQKGTIPYQIKAGDTSYALAKRFNTTVRAIRCANPGLEPSNLKVGQIICIPVARIPAFCPPQNRYTIKAGDTFFKIARKLRVSVVTLSSLNPTVDPQNLQIGQMICVPARRYKKNR